MDWRHDSRAKRVRMRRDSLNFRTDELGGAASSAMELPSKCNITSWSTSLLELSTNRPDSAYCCFKYLNRIAS